MISKFFLLLLVLTAIAKAEDPFQIPTKKMTVVRLHHLCAAHAMRIIEKNESNLLSKKGFFLSNTPQNAILIFDSPTNVTRVKKLLETLDLPTARILIKAKIVVIDEHSLKDLGATLTTHESEAPAASLTFPLLQISTQQKLNFTLNALESNGNAKTISSPQLVVNNNSTASIASGEEIPYQERTTKGNTNVTFKKALLELQVTPHLRGDNRINLSLNLHQDKPSGRIVKGVPAVSTEQIMTTVVVNNGKTLVLGGIYEHGLDHNIHRTPLLNHLPIIGRLLQRHQSANNRKLLVVFITPTVLK